MVKRAVRPDYALGAHRAPLGLSPLRRPWARALPAAPSSACTAVRNARHWSVTDSVRALRWRRPVLDGPTAMPLVLYLATDGGIGDDLASALAMIEAFILRRDICDLTTKKSRRAEVASSGGRGTMTAVSGRSPQCRTCGSFGRSLDPRERAAAARALPPKPQVPHRQELARRCQTTDVSSVGAGRMRKLRRPLYCFWWGRLTLSGEPARKRLPQQALIHHGRARGPCSRRFEERPAHP